MAYYNSAYNQPSNVNFNGNSQSYNNGYSSSQYGNIPPIIVFVNGEQGANNYPVAAGNTVYLMDFESGQFWIKSTNSNGSPQPMRSFSFKETTPKIEANNFEGNYVTKKELDDLKEYLDGQFKGIKNQLHIAKRGPVNDKSDVK